MAQGQGPIISLTGPGSKPCESSCVTLLGYKMKVIYIYVHMVNTVYYRRSSFNSTSTAH